MAGLKPVVQAALKPVVQAALKPVVQVAWSALVDLDCLAVEELGYSADSIPPGVPLHLDTPKKTTFERLLMKDRSCYSKGIGSLTT